MLVEKRRKQTLRPTRIFGAIQVRALVGYNPYTRIFIMPRINNVNLDGVQAFLEAIKAEPAKARKTQVIEGEWLFEGNSQFRSVVGFEGGQATIEADNPTFMGGRGTLPGPMQYCFYGFASCYTGVFATMASMLGIELKKLSVRVEADINFEKVFGISDAPIIEEIRVKISVASDAPEEKIREAERLAQERCPAVYTLGNIIPLKPSLEIQ